MKNFTYPTNQLMSIFAVGDYKTIIFVQNEKLESVMNATVVTTMLNLD
jgi:hypothetical protein